MGKDVATLLSDAFSTDTPSEYFASRLAVAAALIATASPHLTLPLRRIGRWILFLGSLACIVLGVSVAIGTLAAFLTGIAGAAIVHLLLGSPGGRLTIEEVADALEDMGVEATDLRAAPLGPRGVELVDASTSDGRPLLVKIFGRDARGGEFLSSTWSSLSRKGHTLRAGSGWQQVEREALASRVRGARVGARPAGDRRIGDAGGRWRARPGRRRERRSDRWMPTRSTIGRSRSSGARSQGSARQASRSAA